YSMIAFGLYPRPSMFKLWDRPKARLAYTWHQHWANAATCLMFVLVGVSTGLLLRKGTQLTALAVAVGYAMVYWIASLRLGKQLAREGVLEPWIGAWGPLALFSIVGLWLTHRAFRE
ncbi:MAG: lipopolysaccharide export LptBFGC system permease protein LptF, partial [Candidatus Paceibacteria bacterium]